MIAMNDLRNIKNLPHLRGILLTIKEEYHKLKKSDIPKLTDELYNIFYTTGSRQEYERVYFLRRGRLLTTAVMSLCDDKYFDELLSVISDICEEKTWALPPHVSRDNKNPERVIDLFSAETGEALSEITDIFKDKIPQKTYDMIFREIKRRIVNPFMEENFFWENNKYNWAAVCAGSVGMTFIYMFPKEFEKIRERILDTLSLYLDGFGNDGMTTEGLAYWNYGIRYFMSFAMLYKERYGTDLTDNKKLLEISKAQQNMILHNDIGISFSDSRRSAYFNTGLAHLLKGIYGDEIKLIKSKPFNGIDNCYRFAECIGTLKYTNSEFIGISDTLDKESYLSDAEWYINRGNEISLAAKCGDNGDPHNHNDVGSFIIANADVQILCDYGAGEYTAEYFSPKRYEYLCTSSRGHSVPIIDNEYQKSGKQYSGTVKIAGDNVFEIEISGAYEVERLKSLTRRFQVLNDTICLLDTFEFTDKTVHKITERFVSVIKPELTDEGVKINNIIIKSKNAPVISSENLMSHTSKEETIYFIDYESDVSFKIEFRCIKA